MSLEQSWSRVAQHSTELLERRGDLLGLLGLLGLPGLLPACWASLSGLLQGLLGLLLGLLGLHAHRTSYHTHTEHISAVNSTHTMRNPCQKNKQTKKLQTGVIH